MPVATDDPDEATADACEWDECDVCAGGSAAIALGAADGIADEAATADAIGGTINGAIEGAADATGWSTDAVAEDAAARF